DFAREHGVPVSVCGKLVVATSNAELTALGELAERARANGVPATLITPARAREYEPEVTAVAALRVESTAVIDFSAVCEVLVGQLRSAGARLRFDAPVRAIRRRSASIEVLLDVPSGPEIVAGDALVNCAGLHADRVARLAGMHPTARIVPFRGEYYELAGRARRLVRGLVYPVPDPSLPFLGVHLTRMLDGSVHAGPNAVLALSREGYSWRDVSVHDVVELARFPGVWRFARRYAFPIGWDEVRRSLSRKRFAASIARMVPAVGADDLIRAGTGVRAQAMRADGALVQDFLIERAPRQVHVINAPSPAATCAFEIAATVADQLS
ncbi:MAG: L-2-hydroxyglutarate oxidase, partial [Sciscionella sp.]|nr:L-2-hydroxyglutarate oxidase [Sciscionella sp.]